MRKQHQYMIIQLFASIWCCIFSYCHCLQSLEKLIYISNTSLYARDSGAIYMHGTVLGSDRAYTSIHHNYIHDTGNYDSFYADIYFDNHSQYGVAYNNVSYATDKAFDRENIVAL